MSNTDFHQTPMGRDFYERIMPKLADAIDRLADQTAPLREALEFTLPFIAKELQRHNDTLAYIADWVGSGFIKYSELQPERPSFEDQLAEYRKRRHDEEQ